MGRLCLLGMVFNCRPIIIIIAEITLLYFFMCYSVLWLDRQTTFVTMVYVVMCNVNVGIVPTVRFD